MKPKPSCAKIERFSVADRHLVLPAGRPRQAPILTTLFRQFSGLICCLRHPAGPCRRGGNILNCRIFYTRDKRGVHTDVELCIRCTLSRCGPLFLRGDFKNPATAFKVLYTISTIFWEQWWLICSDTRLWNLGFESSNLPSLQWTASP